MTSMTNWNAKLTTTAVMFFLQISQFLILVNIINRGFTIEQNNIIISSMKLWINFSLHRFPSTLIFSKERREKWRRWKGGIITTGEWKSEEQTNGRSTNEMQSQIYEVPKCHGGRDVKGMWCWGFSVAVHDVNRENEWSFGVIRRKRHMPFMS